MPTDLPRLRIDIVSDVVCPWCVIGYKQLELALADFEGRAAFDVCWQPFELNPGLLPGGEDLREHIARKYGSPPEASAGTRERLTALGRELGFEFDYFEGMRIYNTFDAHKLLHWARDSGRQTHLKMAFFRAFFQQRKAIEDHAVLLGCVEAVGLYADAAREALVSPELERAVREAQSDWLDRYISGVPTFVFDGDTMMTGAHPPAILVRAIDAALERRAPTLAG